MTERPIPMNAWSVRRLQAGAKTQTRRLRGLKRVNINPGEWRCAGQNKFDEFIFWGPEDEDGLLIRCPYGVPGDRLWVRETIHNRPEDGNFYYAADNQGVGEIVFERLVPTSWIFRKTIPSIFMPRWASRITLELTDVRVERVQDISTKGDDILAEGIEFDVDAPVIGPCEGDAGALVEQFASLWDSLNAKRGFGWESNCWVWVLKFKRLQP